jgi:hypothetical protein
MSWLPFVSFSGTRLELDWAVRAFTRSSKPRLKVPRLPTFNQVYCPIHNPPNARVAIPDNKKAIMMSFEIQEFVTPCEYISNAIEHWDGTRNT